MKPQVLIHKKTAQLVVRFKSWLGFVIDFSLEEGDEPIKDWSKFIFEDDSSYDLTQYEVLGEL